MKETSLFLFDPNVVLSKLKKKKDELSTLHSRLLTAQDTPLSLDITTLSLVIPIRLGKTPYNVAEVTYLVKQIKDRKIDQSVRLKKLAKATQFFLAKVIVVQAQNEDLVKQLIRHTRRETNIMATLKKDE